MRQVLTTFLAIALVAGCGRDAPSATDAPQRAAISSRELEDASDAIEKFMQAGRTREAELLARKLRDSVGDGDAARTRVAELASRAFFAHAESSDLHLHACNTIKRSRFAEPFNFRD